ncbi:triple gene block protein 3 [Potexvirus ecsalstroemeriae]|uniref:Movement protein TGBp3 n=1 Tax=Potexvirus ecsalstroemeriae TaxID=316983 RepID=Q3V6G4_9VIRU|nr:triple gene block protein 3 [Alstroemeria virus X]BAE44214.1 triple gene block protein 3 [Alstroemeria virus X]
MAPKLSLTFALLTLSPTLINGWPSHQSSPSASSFGYVLNFLLVIGGLYLLYALTAPPTKAGCIVRVTGESVTIDNCPDTALIMEKFNLAPWNGVKFPKE